MLNLISILTGLKQSQTLLTEWNIEIAWRFNQNKAAMTCPPRYCRNRPYFIHGGLAGSCYRLEKADKGVKRRSRIAPHIGLRLSGVLRFGNTPSGPSENLFFEMGHRGLFLKNVTDIIHDLV